MTYGTGAIMAVPGHDERDHEFATTFDIPIVEVISGGEKPIEEAPFEGDGVVLIPIFSTVCGWMMQKRK